MHRPIYGLHDEKTALKTSLFILLLLLLLDIQVKSFVEKSNWPLIKGAHLIQVAANYKVDCIIMNSSDFVDFFITLLFYCSIRDFYCKNINMPTFRGCNIFCPELVDIFVDGVIACRLSKNKGTHEF